MVVLLGISLLSGMRAGWEFVDSPLGGADGVWSAMLHAIAPKATLFGVNLLILHVMSVWFLLLTAGIYTVYTDRPVLGGNVLSRAVERLHVCSLT